MARRDYFSSLPYKLIQRRWMVIAPCVAVMSLVFAYTRNVDLYRSSAIVTFQTEYVLADRDRTIKDLFEQKVSGVVSSLRFGDPMRSIVQKAFPNLDQEENLPAFNGAVSRLGSKNGIQLGFRRDNYRALNISYTSRDPDEAYRVVKATLDTLIEESKEITERRVANSASFLQKEIEAYNKQLKAVDQEIIRIESGFAPIADSSSASGIPEADPSGLLEGAQLRKQVSYHQTLPQLEFDLKVAEKELNRLIKRLEDKSYLSEAGELEGLLSVGDDFLLKELRTSIAAKEKERHLLASQGYLERHPKRKSLEAEIRNLKKLERQRTKELSEEAGEQGHELAKLKLERQLRAEISKKTEEIGRLKDRIAVMKRYQEEVASQKDSLINQVDLIAAQRSKLDQLKRQKYVTTDAYQNAVSELELIKRQGRADEGDIGLRIEIAEAPTLPKSPLPLAHMSTIVMGFALSLAGGVGLVCIIDALDTSVMFASELREIVPVPVIGEVDRMLAPETKAKEKNKTVVLLVVLALIVVLSEQIVQRFFL